MFYTLCILSFVFLYFWVFCFVWFCFVIVRNPFMSFPAGVMFGAYMMWFRFFSNPDGAPKPAFDLERPMWGVLGGFKNWMYGIEPSEAFYFWQFCNTKYRTS